MKDLTRLLLLLCGCWVMSACLPDSSDGATSGGSPGDGESAVGKSSGDGRPLLGSGDVGDDEIFDLIMLHRNTIARNLGRDLVGPIDVAITRGELSATPADSVPLGVAGQGCRLVFFPDSIGELSNTVAHQVFRCFQYDSTTDVLAAWISAGQPHFFDDLVAGESPKAAVHYSDHGCSPSQTLFTRGAPAVAFYAALDSLGLDPWQAVDPMLELEGIEAVRAAGVEPLDLVERLSTMIALDGGFGPNWTHDAIGRPSSSCMREEFFDGETTLEIIEEVGSLGVMVPRAVTVRGDVVQMNLAGQAGGWALDGGTHHSWRGETTSRFCVAEQPCVCPDGTPAAEHVGPTTVALGGGAIDGGVVTATFTAVGLEEACGSGPHMQIDVDGVALVLRGGLCFIDDAGFLQGAFGYVAGWDGQRQADPFPDASVGLLSQPVSGGRLGASLFIALDGGATRQVSPGFDIADDLRSGTFGGDGVSGSFECGAFQDPSAPQVGG